MDVVGQLEDAMAILVDVDDDDDTSESVMVLLRLDVSLESDSPSAICQQTMIELMWPVVYGPRLIAT